MHERTDNPYEPPRTLRMAAKTIWCRRYSAHLVMGFHLAAVVASLCVVQSNTILSSRLLETAIALPLVSTIVLFPLVAIYITRVTMRDSPMNRVFVVLGEIVLSVIQILIWLPTVQ